MKLTLIVLSVICLHGNILMSQSTYPDFDQLDGLEYDEVNGELTKSIKSTWDEGSAFSSNLLEAGSQGYVEYTAENIGDTKAFGIATVDQSAKGLTQLYYAYYITKGDLYITHLGKVVSKLGRVKAGVDLKMEVANDMLSFYMGGKPLMRFGITSTDYVVGAFIYNQGGGFRSVQTDFLIPDASDDDLNYGIDKDVFTPVLTQDSRFKVTADLFSFVVLLDRVEENSKLDYNLYARHGISVKESVLLINENVSKGANNLDLDVSNLPEGVYNLEIKMSNNEVLRSKLIIE